jgi:hypothetical protein
MNYYKHKLEEYNGQFLLYFFGKTITRQLTI